MKPLAPTLQLVLSRAERATTEAASSVDASRMPYGADVRRERLERSGISLCLPAGDVARIADPAGALELPMLAHVRQWLTTPRPILVLSGLQGRGKTVAAAWAIALLGGVYLSIEDLVRLAGARFGADAARFGSALGSAMLVLDDVGRESAEDAERVRAALVELVDKRRGDRMRTIVTTNLSARDFAKAYPDPRLTSRLTQSAAWRTDVGPDLRRGDR